jgi:hypothetical protein
MQGERSVGREGGLDLSNNFGLVKFSKMVERRAAYDWFLIDREGEGGGGTAAQ